MAVGPGPDTWVTGWSLQTGATEQALRTCAEKPPTPAPSSHDPHTKRAIESSGLERADIVPAARCRHFTAKNVLAVPAPLRSPSTTLEQAHIEPTTRVDIRPGRTAYGPVAHEGQTRLSRRCNAGSPRRPRSLPLVSSACRTHQRFITSTILVDQHLTATATATAPHPSKPGSVPVPWPQYPNVSIGTPTARAIDTSSFEWG
jgi:hypothetical protein